MKSRVNIKNKSPFTPKTGEKLFIVRKYIFAKSAVDAIKKDKVTDVADVWVDEEWKQSRPGASVIGFEYEGQTDYGMEYADSKKKK